MKYLMVRRDRDEDEEDDVVIHKHTHHHHHHSPMSEVHGARESEYEHKERHHPTWDKYRGKTDGHMSILEMEFGELMAAYAAGDSVRVYKELCDLEDACDLALKMHRS